MSTSTSSALTPQTMTGVSSMSTSLQAILTRAVQIAQLPITQLQNKDSDALTKVTLLAGFTDAATSLGDAVTALGKLAAGNMLGATSSDSTLVSVQNTGATSAATYTVSNILSVASNASATTTAFSSTSGTTVSSTGSMELKFGSGSSDTYDFTLTDNTITGLRDKINSLGAGVTATVLTTGSSNYLSITANNTGAVTDFSLVDDPTGAATQLLSSPNLGSDASFSLNGVAITQSSNYVNSVVPGLTFTILKKPTDSTTSVALTLAPDSSQLSSAISTFVTAYNSMFSTVGAQVGTSGGMLSGDYIVRESQQNLRALATYAGSGAVKSLAEMGLTFDSTGKLSFDTTTFDAMTDSQVQGAISFFGSTTTGFGALAKKFTQMTDPISGDIKLESDGYTATDKSLQTQIATLTDRANAMQTALASRLETADTLIASLESQKSVLSASIDSLSYVLYGKVTSASSS